MKKLISLFKFQCSSTALCRVLLSKVKLSYLLLIVLAYLPSQANAEAYATASLTNFSIQVSSVLATSMPDYSTFSAVVINSIDDYQFGNSEFNFDFAELPENPYSFSISASPSQYAYPIATASYGQHGDSGLTTRAGVGLGNAYSFAGEYLSFMYTANTTLLITADAIITGATGGLTDSSESHVYVSLSDGLFENPQGNQFNDLFHTQANGGNYSFSQKVAFSYSSDVSTTLYFIAETTSTAIGNSNQPVIIGSPVPEPSSYALLLAGLGFIRLITKRLPHNRNCA